jgi:hypothetical protein
MIPRGLLRFASVSRIWIDIYRSWFNFHLSKHKINFYRNFQKKENRNYNPKLFIRWNIFEIMFGVTMHGMWRTNLHVIPINFLRDNSSFFFMSAPISYIWIIYTQKTNWIYFFFFLSFLLRCLVCYATDDTFSIKWFYLPLYIYFLKGDIW